MKRIQNYTTYSITEDGRVFSHRLRAGWLTPSVDKAGYHRYHITSDTGKRKGMYAHQLVALAYLENPEDKPFVNHLDHDKSNNRVENLAWCTHLENIQHDWKMGKRKNPARGEKNWSAKHSDVQVQGLKDLRSTGVYSIKQLAQMFEMPWQTVTAICSGRIRSNT